MFTFLRKGNYFSQSMFEEAFPDISFYSIYNKVRKVGSMYVGSLTDPEEILASKQTDIGLAMFSGVVETFGDNPDKRLRLSDIEGTSLNLIQAIKSGYVIYTPNGAKMDNNLKLKGEIVCLKSETE